MTNTHTSLKDAFLQNYARYIAVFGDDLGYVPPTEWSRKAGMGEIIRPSSDTARFAHAKPPVSHAGIAGLAAAYTETGDEQYAETAKAYYLGWIRENPLDNPETTIRKRVDSIAHGLYGWLGTLHVLVQSPAFDEETVTAIIGSAREQLEILCDNVYPDRNLRNTYAASLLCNGLRLAFLPEAARWIAFGAHVMSETSHRQTNPDGSHMEATPHYQFCTMGDILNAFRKARLLPELGMNMSPEVVASLYDYLAAATHPTGWITAIHDGNYGDPGGVRGNGVADILEERASFRASLGLPEAPLPTVQIFPDAGQAFLRDRWTNDATYLTFDVSACRSYHWHPSRNAIQLQAFGRRLLVDPGRFSYRDPAWGKYASRTHAHSTINLNGWDQARSAATLRHRSAPGYDLVEGFYNGGYWEEDYTRGIFAEHHRAMLWIRDRCVVVIDNLLCPSTGDKPRLECVWQLSEGGVTIEPEARRAYTGHDDANLLMLFPLQPAGVAMSVHEGETDPLRGWVPRTFETGFIPAPQVVLSADAYDPWHADFATVLIPYRGTDMPQVAATAPVDPQIGDFLHPGYGQIRLCWEDGTTDEIYWRRKLETALDGVGDFLTDGSLVHLCQDSAGALIQGLVVDGTYITPYMKEKRERAGTFTL